MDNPFASDPFPRGPEPDPGDMAAQRSRLLALRVRRETARSFPDDAPILGLQPPLPRGLRRRPAEDREQG